MRAATPADGGFKPSSRGRGRGQDMGFWESTRLPRPEMGFAIFSVLGGIES